MNHGSNLTDHTDVKQEFLEGCREKNCMRSKVNFHYTTENLLHHGIKRIMMESDVQEGMPGTCCAEATEGMSRKYRCQPTT